MVRRKRFLESDNPCLLSSCCRVESVVSIDERGQLILPKEVRRKMGLLPGNKLMLVSLEKDGQVCCLALLRADLVEKEVSEMIIPLFQMERQKPKA